MSSLLDTIYKYGVEIGGHSVSPEKARELYDLDECVKFDITNVSDYFFTVSPRADWTARDFPIVSPLFRDIWLEYAEPKAVNINGEMVESKEIGTPKSRTGITLQTRTVEEIRQDPRLIRGIGNTSILALLTMALETGDLSFFQEAQRYERDLNAGRFRPAFFRDTHWVELILIFYQLDKRRVYGPAVLGLVNVKENGEFACDPIHGGFLSVGIQAGEAIVKERGLDVFKETVTMAHHALSPVWLALSFAHAKNVQIKKEVATLPPKLIKKRAKSNRPYVRFNTLEIQAMKQALSTEGGANENGLQQALTICRGHFKDYRQNGLFGRNHGIYWWENHVRGSSEVGINVNDYRI